MDCERVLEAVKLGEESPEIWDHLAGCPSCRAKCESTAFVLERNESTEKRPPAALASSMPRWLPWALLGLMVPVVGGLVTVAVVVYRRAKAPTTIALAAPPPAPKPAVKPIAPPPEEPAMARLTVDATPEATVFIDGKKAGPTPWAGQLPPGRVQLELRAEGYHSIRKTVQLTDEEPKTLTFTLKPRDQAASPAAGSALPGAPRDEEAGDDKADEELSLRTPKPLAAKAQPARPSKKEEADTADDEPLKPLGEPRAAEIARTDDAASGGFGYLTISCDPYAQIFLDGRDLGRTTPMTRYSVPAGKHKITLKAKMGTGKVDFDVNVHRGQELQIDKTIE